MLELGFATLGIRSTSRHAIGSAKRLTSPKIETNTMSDTDAASRNQQDTTQPPTAERPLAGSAVATKMTRRDGQRTTWSGSRKSCAPQPENRPITGSGEQAATAPDGPLEATERHG
jgi:hypothetical protein